MDAAGLAEGLGADVGELQLGFALEASDTCEVKGGWKGTVFHAGSAGDLILLTVEIAGVNVVNEGRTTVDAADRIVAGLEKTIQSKVVTYDFARLMEGAKEVKCSEFGTAIVQNMAKL